jgi:ribosomal-protein-alanine N-acetyltransferase
MNVARTERLVLARLEPRDAGFLLELLNDPDFVRFVGDRGLRTRRDARAYLRTGALASYERHGFGHYRVELAAGGEPVGICGLARRDWLDAPDLGFAFLPAHRGRGYAVEAATAVLEEARDRHGLARVLAIALAENHASVRVLARLGFRVTGSVRAPGEDAELTLFARRLGGAPGAVGSDQDSPGRQEQGGR